MSFWNLSDGSDAKEVGSSFEQDGGAFEPIPNNTTVSAAVEEISWKTYYESQAEHVQIKWRISKPEAYANRVLFDKLNLDGSDPNKNEEKNAKAKDNAIRKLVALYNMHGRTLPNGRPTNDDLQKALQNKFANLKVLEWEMDDGNGGTRRGNWVAGVSGKGSVTEAAKEKPAAKPVEDDEIPW